MGYSGEVHSGERDCPGRNETLTRMGDTASLIAFTLFVWAGDHARGVDIASVFRVQVYVREVTGWAERQAGHRVPTPGADDRGGAECWEDTMRDQEIVERVIETMWKRYGEPLTLAELADVAVLSRFYFSRVFRAVTGTSPGRFLTAIRLARAKNLLAETSTSVTEISYKVGYNSLGTFTSRFTRSVGISPARYRHLSQAGIPQLSLRIPQQRTERESVGTVYGQLHVPPTAIPIRTYVGAFASPILQGKPISCAMVEHSESTYRLAAVPPGEWFVQAVTVATRDVQEKDVPLSIRRPVFFAPPQPVSVRGGDSRQLDIHPRPSQPIDVPVLLAIPELDSRTLAEFAPA
jgi:AraC family transcriptional regulator